jgi:signal peptidase II
MLKPWRTTGLSWLWLGLLVLVADQLTKYWALIALIPYDPMSIMPMLNITLAFNTGAAFSFLGDAGGWQRWLFLALAMGVSLALLVWLYRTPSHHFTLNIGLVMVLSGAIGNAIDRASMGMVVDFIDIYYGSWHYPTFNVADIGITLGAILLIWDAWHQKPSATTDHADSQTR